MSHATATPTGKARNAGLNNGAAHRSAAQVMLADLMTPSASYKQFAIAVGHETTKSFPRQLESVTTRFEQVFSSPITERDNDHAAAERLQTEIQESIAAHQAILSALEQSKDITELHTRLLERARDAWTVHQGTTSQMLSQVRDLEIVERGFYCFMVCAVATQGPGRGPEPHSGPAAGSARAPRARVVRQSRLLSPSERGRPQARNALAPHGQR